MTQNLNACLWCPELVDTLTAGYPAHHRNFHSGFVNVLVLKGYSSYLALHLYPVGCTHSRQIKKQNGQNQSV